jgi:hypothetical protein
MQIVGLCHAKKVEIIIKKNFTCKCTGVPVSKYHCHEDLTRSVGIASHINLSTRQW